MDPNNERTTPPQDSSPQDLRRETVHRIFQTLRQHMPPPVGMDSIELFNIAGRLEEKIFQASPDKIDYLRKISSERKAIDDNKTRHAGWVQGAFKPLDSALVTNQAEGPGNGVQMRGHVIRQAQKTHSVDQLLLRNINPNALHNGSGPVLQSNPTADSRTNGSHQVSDDVELMVKEMMKAKILQQQVPTFPQQSSNQLKFQAGIVYSTRQLQDLIKVLFEQLQYQEHVQQQQQVSTLQQQSTNQLNCETSIVHSTRQLQEHLKLLLEQLQQHQLVPTFQHEMLINQLKSQTAIIQYTVRLKQNFLLLATEIQQLQQQQQGEHKVPTNELRYQASIVRNTAQLQQQFIMLGRQIHQQQQQVQKQLPYVVQPQQTLQAQQPNSSQQVQLQHQQAVMDQQLKSPNLCQL